MLVLGGWGHAATAYINIQYKAPCPLPGQVVVVAKLLEQERRKLFVRATLSDYQRKTIFVSPTYATVPSDACSCGREVSAA